MATQTLSDSDIKFKITYDMNQGTPRFNFEDETTAYGSSGVVPSSEVYFKIKGVLDGSTTPFKDWNAPTSTDVDDWNGTNFTADIIRNTGATRFATSGNYVSVPYSNGEIQNGSYNFLVNVLYRNDSVATTYSLLDLEVTVNINYTKPTGSVTLTADLNPVTPTMTSTDNTVYVVDSVTPTINRTMTLYYPPSTGAGSTQSSNASFSVTSFYTNTQELDLLSLPEWDFTSKISTSATNDFTSGNLSIVLNDKIEATDEYKVQSTSTLCSLICGLRAFESRKSTARTNNPALYQQMKSDAGEIGYYIDLIEISYRCDKTDEINDYVININRLTNATGDCGCSGDEPVLITSITGGLNPTNNIYVYTNSTGGALTTRTEADLIGLTYEVSGSPRRNDFVVYLGGVLDNLTAFDDTTGLLTFSGSLTNGSELTILRIR
jgi:hypothetical protein